MIRENNSYQLKNECSGLLAKLRVQLDMSYMHIIYLNSKAEEQEEIPEEVKDLKDKVLSGKELLEKYQFHPLLTVKKTHSLPDFSEEEQSEIENIIEELKDNIALIISTNEELAHISVSFFKKMNYWEV